MRRLAAFACSLVIIAACSDGGSDSSSETPQGAPTVAKTEPTITEPAATTTVPAATSTEPAATSTVPATTTTEPRAQYAATIDELLAIGRPIVLAHTAGEDEFPASTLFAFGESVKAGVDMLDLNLNITADDELVVQHDDTVDRNTDGAGAVASMTMDQIRELDAAYWFSTDCADCRDLPGNAYLYRGVRTGSQPAPMGYTADDFALPTLRELVERFPDLPLNIEIKGAGEMARKAADVLAAELVELGRADASVVASFDDEVVSYFHSIAPDIEVSPGLNVLTAYVLNETPIPDGMRILQLPPEFSGLTVITPELVARSNADDLPIWVWPNDRRLENYDAYLAFLQQGIAGPNINFPEQGVQAVRDFIRPGALRAAEPTAACTTDAAALEPTLPCRSTLPG